MNIDRDTLVRLWPRAPSSLISGIVDTAPEVFLKYNINTPLRLAHFMAQISHESDGGTITEENMNYTTAARIAAVWPSRFTLESAIPYVRNPRKLADKVYNGRMGNQVGTDDGYNFRGRGLLQLTGKESYQRIGKLTDLDLVNDPSLANSPSAALEVAACEFQDLKCLPACDVDDIRTVTKRVNGGYIGIDSRRAWLQKWKLAIPDLPGELPKSSDDLKALDDPLPRQADGDPAHKTMATSTEGWAAVIATLTAALQTVGSFLDTVKPFVTDPRIFIPLSIIGVCAGIYIWFRRRNRLIEDHV